MTVEVQTKPLAERAKDYCNLAAQALGLDPAGHADEFDDAIVLETPLPWKRDLYEKAGVLPQEAIDLLALWLQRYRAGHPYNHRPLLIAPDPEYSHPGHRRVIYYSRQPGAFARFAKREYLAPIDQVGPLIWALYEAPADLPRFDPYRVPEADDVRDILVCTHGTIDVACAKFGFPLYRYLRDHHAGAQLRVWRVSHFGGHVFAPTLIDMPVGHYWAYVGTAQADQIVQRTGDVAALYGNYRGWAGLGDGFPQAAEGAMWQQEGWDWFDYDKTCRVLAADSGDDPAWMELCIDFVRPDGSRGVYEARVEIERKIETFHTTGDSRSYAYAQYGVSLREISTTLASFEASTHPGQRYP